MPRDKDRPRYSSVNEDGDSERRALALGPADRALVITGSGARVLDLMLDRPERIVAIDCHASQGRLLALKLAAARALDPVAAQSFLGLRPPFGLQIVPYAHVRRRLSKPDATWWDDHLHLVAEGPLRCGSWDRHFERATRPIRSSRRVDRLLSCRSVEEQVMAWTEDWDPPAVRLIVEIACSRFMGRYVLRDPAFWRGLPRGLRAGRIVMDRLRHAAGRQLFRESPFAWLLFRGGLSASGPLPTHLSTGGLATVAGAATDVSIVTDDLVHHLETCEPQSYDAYSLSDIGSYLDRPAHDRLWREIVRTARPGARVCERRFLVDHPLPEDIAHLVSRDRVLENELAATDRALLYSFVTARICP